MSCNKQNAFAKQASSHDIDAIAREMDRICGKSLSIDIKNAANLVLVAKKLLQAVLQLVPSATVHNIQRLACIIEWIAEDWPAASKHRLICLVTRHWAAEAQFILWQQLQAK